MNVSVWANFTNITVELENVLATDYLYHRPFLQAKEILCAVGLLRLAAPPPYIQTLKIAGGALHLFIDSAGFNNSCLLSPRPNNNGAPAAVPSSKTAIIHRIEVVYFEFISD